MTILASDIIVRAGDVLFDTTQVRWPETELLRWLNDAQREIVLQRPDAKSANQAVKLVARVSAMNKRCSMRISPDQKNQGS